MNDPPATFSEAEAAEPQAPVTPEVAGRTTATAARRRVSAGASSATGSSNTVTPWCGPTCSPELVRATGNSHGHLAEVQRGLKVPHTRHWPALGAVIPPVLPGSADTTGSLACVAASEPHAEYVDRIINRLPPDLAAVFAEHITPEKMRELLINAVGLVAERHIGEVFAEFQRLIVQEVPRTR